MLNSNSIDSAVVVSGVEYVVRELPAQYQNTDSSASNRARTYYASVCGRILSRTKRGVWRVLRPVLNPNYRESQLRNRVMLCVNGKESNHYVHTLVAAAWLLGRDELCPHGLPRNQVNHINEQPLDNRVANLEWTSRLVNVRHSTQRMIAVRAEQSFAAGVPERFAMELLLGDSPAAVVLTEALGAKFAMEVAA